jgi:predicted aspartyl protease
MVRTLSVLRRPRGGGTARWLPAGGAVVALILLADATSASAQAASAQAAVSAEAASPVEDALLAAPTTRDHIGRVVVPVMINGRGPFRFIVDTGASHSTVSPSVVQALGLKPTDVPSILLEGITGSARVSAVTVDRLEAGALTVSATPMPVVWAPVMAGADGILGAAGLTNQSLMVDFEHNRVRIADEVEPAVRSESMRIHGLRITHGLLIVETRVGGVRVNAVVDTGSERTLGNRALRDAVNIKRTAGVMARVTSVYGATKQIESGEIVDAPVIALGSLRVLGVEVVYGDFHIFKVWGMEDKPAMIIGMDVLGTVGSLGIDFKNHDLYLASNRLTGDPFSTVHGYTSDRVSR